MAENCRSSCNSCYTQSELRRMCGTTAGSVAPVAQVRQTNPSRQPPRGGWGRDDFGDNGGWGGNGGGGWGNNDPWGGSRWGGGRGGWGGGGWGGGGWGKRSIRAANASISMPSFDPDLL